MSESTLEAPPIPPSAAPDRAVEPEPIPWTLRGFMRAHPWWSTAIGLTLFSAVVVVWARTRPGFDPYGWLVWGHQTVSGSLNTNAAPSWKPLPYLFTAPYALAGHYQLRLWMITSLAISLSGAVFAGRIAYRLTGARRERRWAAYVAGAFAGLALLGIRDYWHYMLSAQSDPMIVALCLGAIDCHLSGRRRWAFVLGSLAALGRPEVWPFLLVYSIWAWRTIPAMRWLIVAGAAVILALWFGIPALTSRSPFVAGTNALGSGRALHNDKVFGTVHRFLELYAGPLEIVALLSVGLALVRRDRVLLALAAGAAAWVAVEVAFALHGWPGLPRYMFEAAAVMVVLAAVLVGRLLADASGVAASVRLRPVPAWAGVALVILILASLVPSAVSRAHTERKDLRVQRARTGQINRLSAVVSALGGPARFRPCGEPLTRLEYQTALAWTLHVNVASVGFKYEPAIHSGRPIVLFTPGTHGGWRVQALHQRLPQCRSLPR